MKARDLPIFTNPKARDRMSAACRKRGLSLELMTNLLDAYLDFDGMGRRHGIFADYRDVIDEFIESEVLSTERSTHAPA